MKLVMTILVRDEADVIDAQIAFHLATGVDFVIAADHESVDGTTDILESYAREGRLLRVPVTGKVDEVAWRSQMARIAATDIGADWVINTDADEFWLPYRGSLKEVLDSVPSDFGVVGGVICHFVPRPDDGRPFYERMTTRLLQHAPVNDPISPWRPSPKVVHRGDPEVTILHAGYWIEASGRLRQLPNWRPFEVLHFPCRSVEQWGRKTGRRGHADSDAPLGQYVRGLDAQHRGRIREIYEALVVDDGDLERGIAEGVLVEDRRLSEALASLADEGEASAPGARTVVPDTSCIRECGPPIDAAALFDATVVRLQRRVDDASRRLTDVERRASSARLTRYGSRTIDRIRSGRRS